MPRRLDDDVGVVRSAHSYIAHALRESGAWQGIQPSHAWGATALQSHPSPQSLAEAGRNSQAH